MTAPSPRSKEDLPVSAPSPVRALGAEPPPAPSIEDLVPGERTRHLPVRILVARLGWLILLLLLASAVVVELIRWAVGS